MAGRSKYTAEDKARVHIALHANDGNVKRTARETGIPEQTVRDWKHEWDKEGVPDEVGHALTGAVDAFVGNATRIRDLALARLEEVIPTSDKVRDLTVAIGILDDKITRARGLPTSRQESIVALPSPEQMRELFAGYVTGALADTREREAEIIDAEVVEQAPRALNAVASN